jgi:hypothetical protein
MNVKSIALSIFALTATQALAYEPVAYRCDFQQAGKVVASTQLELQKLSEQEVIGKIVQGQTIEIAGGKITAKLEKGAWAFLEFVPSAETAFDVSDIDGKNGFPMASGGKDGIGLAITSGYIIQMTVNEQAVTLDCDTVK